LLQARRDLRPERVTAARALARESRVEDLRAVVAELRADPDLTPDEDLELGIALAVALTNAEDMAAARLELERVRPLLPRVSALSAASFHTCVGISADGYGEEAVSSIVLAVAAAAGLSPGIWQQAVGYAMLCWAMRLEHLGQDEEAKARYLDAEEQLALALADPEIGVLPRALVRANRALALARLGDAAGARRSLEESRDTPARPVTSLLRRRRLHAECVVLMAEGKREDARHLLTAYWQEAAGQKLPPFAEDGAFLLARLAEAEDRAGDALRWYREVHERYGRAQYAVWVSRAAAARLRVDQEALLRRARQLEYDSLSDPLTEVPNRRAFDANLPRLVGDAQAAGAPLSLAILDVDRFKRVNDTHGHLVGDEVLRTVARLLREHTRTADRCARYGGDEFVLCLPAGRREAAAAVARIVRAVADHDWDPVDDGLTVTISAGLAELGPTDTASTLFWAADQSLLEAKRNRPPG
jgi:diguanylate cyclase (GGDEF)-like protein